MCTIQEHLDVFPLLAKTGLRMHEDYHCVIDSTMVRLWYGEESQRDRIRSELDSVPSLTRLDESYLSKEHCCFPDSRFFEDCYLADPGVLLHPSHLGKVPLAGMHGYDCDHEDSNASLLTNDESAQASEITDIYGLMERAVHQISG